MEWVIDEILLYSIVNYIQSLILEQDGGNCGEKNMYIHRGLVLFAVKEKWSTLNHYNVKKMIKKYPTTTGSAFTREGVWLQTPESQE